MLNVLGHPFGHQQKFADFTSEEKGLFKTFCLQYSFGNSAKISKSSLVVTDPDNGCTYVFKTVGQFAKWADL